MRILHLVHQYLPEYVGGVELYAHWLTESQVRRGYQVSVFYRRSAEGVGREVQIDEGVRVWAAWADVVSPTRRFLNTFRDPSMGLIWRQVLQEFNPDLVHIQHLMGLPVQLVVNLRRRNIPYLITLHDYWWICANAQLLTNYDQTVCDGPRGYWNCAHCALARAGKRECLPARFPIALLFAWRNRRLHRVLEGAAYIIAPTQFVADWYVRHGIAARTVRVISHGLPVPQQLPLRISRHNRPLRFAYIGGLSWQKGVHILIAAFRDIQGDVELWIAGDESCDPDYVAHLRELATPNVHFLGRLARASVWDTLAQVDVVTVPTLCYETFSFIVSEAFAAELPVIASRSGALPDRVRDGVDGLLLPPGDVAAWRGALQRLIDEPDFLSRLQANVRPPVTLDEHVSQVEALYAQLVAENSPDE